MLIPDAARVPAWLRRGSRGGAARYIPEGFCPRFLAIAWPEIVAVVVSRGTEVEGRRFPAGSVVALDEYQGTADGVARFAWRNKLPPCGFAAAAVPELAAHLHVATVEVPRETAARLATTMLARAGTDAPGLYLSERCARWRASPEVSDALALACWVARAQPGV